MALNVAIVGAGLTGAAAAVRLARAGAQVTVFDIGRAPGGRASSREPRKPDEASFDYGLQFIAPARTTQFAEVLQEWEQQGIVGKWQGRIGLLHPSRGFIPRQDLTDDGSFALESAGFLGSSAAGSLGVSGPLWVGLPTNRSLVSNYLATQPSIQVQCGMRVARAELSASNSAAAGSWRLHGISAAGGKGAPLQELGTFSALIITDHLAAKTGSPGYLELQLPHDTSPSSAPAQIQAAVARLRQLQRVPVFSLMVGFATAAQEPLLPFDAAVIPEGPLAWVAVNSSKPGRSSFAGMQTLVAITSPSFSRQLLFDTPPSSADAPLPPQTPEYLAARTASIWEAVQSQLTPALGGKPLPQPAVQQLHRWGSAYTEPALGTPCIPVHSIAGRGRGAGFVVAGDFCLGAGAENAVLSGVSAADAVTGSA